MKEVIIRLYSPVFMGVLSLLMVSALFITQEMLGFLSACVLFTVYIFAAFDNQRTFLGLRKMFSWIFFVFPTLVLIFLHILMYVYAKRSLSLPIDYAFLFLLLSVLQMIQWIWFFKYQAYQSLAWLSVAVFSLIVSDIFIVEPIQSTSEIIKPRL